MEKLLQILAALPLLLFTERVQGQPFTRDTGFHLGINFFGPGSSGSTNQVLELPDDKLLVSGNYTAITSYTDYTGGIVRFFADGQPDPSFIAPDNMNLALTYHVLPADYGYWVMYDLNYITRLNHSGQQVDTLYDHNIRNHSICSMSRPVLFEDGSLLIGGGGCGFPKDNPVRYMNLMRVLPDGQIDTTFHHDADWTVIRLLRYDSSSILVGGLFEAYDSVQINSICRIDTLGNLDTTFHSIFTSGLALPNFVQPDGKIIVTGSFTIQNYPDTLGLVRLHPNGSLDSTFNNFYSVFPFVTGNASSICPTSDGGFLIGGNFTQYQGAPKGRIAKTDANGFLESQYFTGSGFDSSPHPLPSFSPSVYSITKGKNDQYYICGYFDSYNGQAVQPIIRLNGPLTVGVKQEELQTFNIFPNPASGKVIIEGASSASGKLYLHDVLGRQVLERPFSGLREEIDFSYLPQGVYVVSVTDAQGQKRQQKLIMQR